MRACVACICGWHLGSLWLASPSALAGLPMLGFPWVLLMHTLLSCIANSDAWALLVAPEHGLDRRRRGHAEH